MTTTRGGFRIIELGMRITRDPESAKRDILDAYKNAQCNAVAAADSLNITYRTFWRYVDKLDLTKVLQKMTKQAKKDGTFHNARWAER